MASTSNIPTKAALSTAVTDLSSFISSASSSASAYPQEYSYLNKLLTDANDLYNNYSDSYIAQHSDAYATIIPAINRAIASCRYTFGTVYAESQSTKNPQSIQSSQSTTNPQSTQNPQSKTTPGVKTTSTTGSTAGTATGATTTNSANTSATSTPEKTASETSSTGTEVSFTIKPSESANSDSSDTPVTATLASSSTPVEIPKTGGPSEGASIFFAILVSLLIASVVAGFYYFLSNNRPLLRTKLLALRRKLTTFRR